MILPNIIRITREKEKIMYDILIKNGLLVDGLRSKPFLANLAIKDGKIAKIDCSNSDIEANITINAQGKHVAPGFIDIHTHSDVSFIEDGRCESKIFQGVTTEVVGQCGSTFYPSSEENLPNLRDYVRGRDIDTDYYASTSFRDFIAKAKSKGHSLPNNWITLIGHNALRTSVMRFEGRTATANEIKQMVALLEQEMAAGAWGLSLGLGYAPGIFSNIKELAALGQVVAKYDGMVASHMRNQNDQVFEALDEMFEINRRSGAHVHIAHVKIGGKDNWGQVKKYMDFVHDAQANGVNVTLDMYPYEAASSGITNVLPKWTLAGGIEAAAACFNGPERERLIAELSEKFVTDDDGNRVYIVTTGGRFPEADDKTLTELAKDLGVSIVEALEQVVVKTNGHCREISFAMDPNDVLQFLSQMDIAIGSDGSSMPLDPKLNKGKPHPRNFGTFPRFLRLAREHNLMPIEDAVYKITGLSAGMMGIKNRGILSEGYAADITIFDADQVIDTATYSNPFGKPIGIEHVIVNGQIVVQNGCETKNRPGQFLFKNE